MEPLVVGRFGPPPPPPSINGGKECEDDENNHALSFPPLDCCEELGTYLTKLSIGKFQQLLEVMECIEVPSMQ